MPGLTVSEKNHWKDRLSKRIDKRLEAIAAEEPNLLDRVKRHAREAAMQSLNLADLQAEVDGIDREEDALDKRKSLLHRTMLARVRNVPLDTIDQRLSPAYHKQEIENAIKPRQAIHEDKLLADSEVGHRILQLRREREHLLDTVWLAASSQQIKDLWAKVAELLGDEQTPLQRAALAIQPVTD